MSLLLLFFALDGPGRAWAQDCGDTADTASETLDCDADGFSPADGDCDDTDPAVNPDAVELCGNRVDDDCDGRDDAAEDCDPDRVRGTLSGGSTCGGGGYALLLWLPVLSLPRRRRGPTR